MHYDSVQRVIRMVVLAWLSFGFVCVPTCVCVCDRESSERVHAAHTYCVCVCDRESSERVHAAHTYCAVSYTHLTLPTSVYV